MKFTENTIFCLQLSSVIVTKQYLSVSAVKSMTHPSPAGVQGIIKKSNVLLIFSLSYSRKGGRLYLWAFIIDRIEKNSMSLYKR